MTPYDSEPEEALPGSPLQEVTPSLIRSSNAFVPGSILSPEAQQLRPELIDLLKGNQPTRQHVLGICQQYTEAVVNEAMPFLISRVIERTTEDQKRADLLRETVTVLQEQCDYHFRWNSTLEKFFKGHAVDTQLQNGEAFIKKVFGDNYMRDLEIHVEPKRRKKAKDGIEAPIIKPLGKTKLGEILVVAKLCENLNLDLAIFKKHLFEIRDRRLVTGTGTQGVSRGVTTVDFQQMKHELESLVFTLNENSKKRPAPNAELLRTAKKSRNTRAPVSQSVIEGESEEEENGPSAMQPEEDAGERLPPPPVRSEADDMEVEQEVEEQPLLEVSLFAAERLNEKSPKGAFDLWKYRVLSCGHRKALISFEGWVDSAYVHGHGSAGTFAFDEPSSGKIWADRLFGFHDHLKMQNGRDYVNSWITLPMTKQIGLRQARWEMLSSLVGGGVITQDDGDLRRRKPGLPDLEDDLERGGIPLIENVLRRKSPLEPSFNDLLNPEAIDPARIILRYRGIDSIMRTENCNLWNKIDASEDVLAVHKRLYEEVLFPCDSQIRDRVQRELNFGFFPEGCAGDCEGPATRSPNFEGKMEETRKGLRDAMSWIKNTIPLYYGEPCGYAQSSMNSELSRKSKYIGSRLQGYWAQRLPWNEKSWSNDPHEGLLTRFPSVRDPKGHQEHLQACVADIFGIRSCVGFVGSIREKNIPLAGSMLWSVLFRGERLVVLYGPAREGRKTTITVQKAGDLIIIPPGHEYAWYNIRTCYSEEGNFYSPRMLRSYQIDPPRPSMPHRTVLGTLEILVDRPCYPAARDQGWQTIIGYFMLVQVAQRMTLHPDILQPEWEDVVSGFISLLITPPFAYLPGTRRRLERAELEDCTNFLAWTIPFAAVALHRFIRIRQEKSINHEDDSIDLYEKPEIGEDTDGEAEGGGSTEAEGTEAENHPEEGEQEDDESQNEERKEGNKESEKETQTEREGDNDTGARDESRESDKETEHENDVPDVQVSEGEDCLAEGNVPEIEATQSPGIPTCALEPTEREETTSQIESAGPLTAVVPDTMDGFDTCRTLSNSSQWSN